MYTLAASRRDDFVKNYLPELLKNYGSATSSQKIAPEVKERCVDVRIYYTSTGKFFSEKQRERPQEESELSKA